MEKPRGWGGMSGRDDQSGKRGWLETGPRADAWWLPRREKPTRVVVWTALCQRFFLRWVDRVEAIPKMGLLAGNSVVGKIARKSFRQPR